MIAVWMQKEHKEQIDSRIDCGTVVQFAVFTVPEVSLAAPKAVLATAAKQMQMQAQQHRTTTTIRILNLWEPKVPPQSYPPNK